MSGIAAIIRFDGGPVEPGLIVKMTSRIAHRGPDGINRWVKGSVALGHCKLCTTRESLEETQPLANEDESLVLVMDGWLSNWEELRTELLSRRASLRTRSDAELVLRAYEQWGEDCLSHIDGDFAFLIWDARRREAFCARDHSNTRPFYYCYHRRTLFVASELRAVLHASDMSPSINEGVLTECLGGDWFSYDETLWNGVLRLPGANHMRISSSGTKITRFWAPPLVGSLSYQRDEEYFEHYRWLFADCVRRASRSHKPVAYEVSGGHDSSAILCMADHLRREGNLPTPGLKAYTLGFDTGGPHDEIAFVRSVGSHLGIPIAEVPATFPPLEWYEAAARDARDFPGYPSMLMALELTRRAVDEGCRVIVTGSGGDEWAGGTRLYYAEALAEGRLRELIHRARSDAVESGWKSVLWWLALYGVLPLMPPWAQKAARHAWDAMHLRRQDGGPSWLSAQTRNEFNLRRSMFRPMYMEKPLRLGHQAMLDILNMPGRQIGVELGNRIYTPMGAERRSPMSSRKFVEFGFCVPERLRKVGKENKYMHLRALETILPKSIVVRREKAEFSIAFDRHLNNMHSLFFECLSKSLKKYLDEDGFRGLYAKHGDRAALSGGPIWELWNVFGCGCFLEQSLSTAQSEKFILDWDQVRT